MTNPTIDHSEFFLGGVNINYRDGCQINSKHYTPNTHD